MSTLTCENVKVENPVKRSYVISLGNLTKHNLKQLRTINSSVFPVEYSESFYQNIIKSGKFCKLAYFNDILVGAVCYRFDNVTIKDSESDEATQNTVKKCYIMTLGCLSQFREFGVGTKMLNHVIRKCQKLGNIYSIYLNVHIENEVDIKFYERKGFTISEEVPNYYIDISPSTAYVLEKKVSSCEPVEDEEEDDD